MKIAIICPIGDLNRFGYWRTAQVCLESWRALGDLFLIHSSRSAIPFEVTAHYLKNEDTLMNLVTGVEWFDYHLVADNANRGIQAARDEGYDVAITICVNWYIEAIAAKMINRVCLDMLSDKRDYDMLYRRIQIGARLFHADLESAVIINLQRVPGDVVKVLVDHLEIDGKVVIGQRGDFEYCDDEAYIDCEHELTIDELREKLADIRNYEDVLPKRHGADWGFWQRYYQNRAKTMRLSDDVLGEVGQRIAAHHPVESFGDWLMEQVQALS
jgi:hypothetical protein